MHVGQRIGELTGQVDDLRYLECGVVALKERSTQRLARQVLHDDAGVVLQLDSEGPNDVRMVESAENLPLVHDCLKGRKIDPVARAQSLASDQTLQLLTTTQVHIDLAGASFHPSE